MYSGYKKCYYNDMHEDMDVVEYRHTYLHCYFEQEIREQCWIQMSLSDYFILRNKRREENNEQKIKIENEITITQFLEDMDHHYLDESGNNMVEVHMFSFDNLHVEPNLSVRKKKKKNS